MKQRGQERKREEWNEGAEEEIHARRGIDRSYGSKERGRASSREAVELRERRGEERREGEREKERGGGGGEGEGGRGDKRQKIQSK